VNASEIEAAFTALSDRRKAVQRPAAEQLADAARTDDAVRARLLENVRGEDARRRWGAGYALALLEPMAVEAVPVLLEALGSPDGDLRWASARLLTRADRRPPGLGDALAALAAGSSPLQRKMALYCLRDVGAAVPVDRALLVRALGDTEASVRLAAMAAVAVLLPATRDTAELLVPLVEDRDGGVQRAAAATLGRLGVRTDAVVTRLSRARASADRTLARVAGEALSRLGAGDPTDRP
jgi:HEAT repeat protein